MAWCSSVFIDIANINIKREREKKQHPEPKEDWKNWAEWLLTNLIPVRGCDEAVMPWINGFKLSCIIWIELRLSDDGSLTHERKEEEKYEFEPN